MSEAQNVNSTPLYMHALSVARQPDAAGEWQRPYVLKLEISLEKYNDIRAMGYFSYSPQWEDKDNGQTKYAISKYMNNTEFYHSFRIPTGEKPVYWHIVSKYKHLIQSDVFPRYEWYINKVSVWSTEMEQAMLDKERLIPESRKRGRENDSDKQKCSVPGCQNNSSRYRCSANSHFTFRPTTDSDAEMDVDSDSDSGSDSDWNEVALWLRL